MGRKDLISSSVWLLAGLFITIMSLSSLKIGTVRNPGPGFFPLIVGMVLTFLSLMILLRAIFTKTEENRNISELWANLNWPKMFYAIGILVIYPIVLEIVGFLLTTFLVLTLLCIGIEPKKWGLGIGLSFVSSACSYLLFDRILQVQLPRGFLGF